MKKQHQFDFKTLFYSDEDKENFYLAMQDFTKQFGCFYLGYFVENLEKGIRIGFTSNPDWQDDYVGNHLIDQCHLWNNVVNQFILLDRNFLIFPWDTVKPEKEIEKDIMLYRSEKGIGNNGISFCSQNGILREYFAVAPENHVPNFRQYVSKNISLIHNHINIFRNATKKYIVAGE